MVRWRSLLFVPVTSERFVAKAHTRGADAIILDLEDAVAAAEKERARLLVPEAAALAGQAGAAVLVRINRPWRLAVADLEAVVGPDVDGIVLPKADSADHVRALAGVVAELEAELGLEVGRIALFPRVESAAGVLAAAAIAAADERVVAIGLGASDYTLSTGMEPGGDGNLIASFQLVNAAVAAGVAPLGLASTIVDFADADAFRAVAERSRALGYRGSPCVHPAQVEILNEVFAPTDVELARARRVVEAYEAAARAGTGAILLDGEFVDRPYYDHAKRLLA